MKDLQKRLEEAIDSYEFSYIEALGFQSRPRLALIAGAAIGYKMACDEFDKKLTNNAPYEGATST
jgi:hypothetical protein